MSAHSSGTAPSVRFIALLLAIACGVLVLWGFTDFRASLATKDWPSVTGEVLSSSVERVGRPGSKTRAPRVTYAYTVDGVRYEGDRLSFRSYSSRRVSNNRAGVIASRYDEGAPVEVHYDPDRPSEAVLIPETDSFGLGVAILALCVGCLALYGWMKPESGAIAYVAAEAQKVLARRARA